MGSVCRKQAVESQPAPQSERDEFSDGTDTYVTPFVHSRRFVPAANQPPSNDSTTTPQLHPQQSRTTPQLQHETNTEVREEEVPVRPSSAFSLTSVDSNIAQQRELGMTAKMETLKDLHDQTVDKGADDEDEEESCNLDRKFVANSPTTSKRRNSLELYVDNLGFSSNHTLRNLSGLQYPSSLLEHKRRRSSSNPDDSPRRTISVSFSDPVGVSSSEGMGQPLHHAQLCRIKIDPALFVAQLNR